MQKKEIVIISSTFPRNNNDFINPSVRNLAIKLSKKYKITVLTPDSPEIDTQYLNKFGIDIKAFRYSFFRSTQKLAYGNGIIPNIKSNPLIAYQVIPFLASGIYNLKKELYNNKPYAIISNWLIPSGLISVLSTKKIPIISIAHGSDVNISGPIFNFLQKNVIRKSRKTICLSERLTEKVKNIYPRSNAITISQGVHINTINTDRDINKFLYVGRVSREKGIKKIISAFLSARSIKKDISLTIIGPSYEKLNKNPNESIRFLGPKNHKELQSYYKNFGTLIFFSQIKEGAPNVILEAASHGMPIITNQISGLKDLVNKKTAIISDNDKESLSESILSVIDNYDKALTKSKAMHDLVSDRYNMDKISKKIVKEIENL